MATNQPVIDFQLELPTPKTLTLAEEMNLLVTQRERFGASDPQRRHLSRLLLEADRFPEAIEILGTLEDVDNVRDQMAYGRAYLALQTSEGDRQALVHFEAVARMGETSWDRSAGLAGAGKALVRLGLIDEGRERLQTALAEDRVSRDAFKRLNVIDLKAGRASQALKMADELAGEGVLHSRVLCGRALSIAALDRPEEAREALGLDRFLHDKILAPPAGWDSIAQFNRDLVSEIAAHPGRRGDRYGSASVSSTRVDEPLISRAKVFPHLLEMLRQQIENVVRRLPETDHPLVTARPKSAFLRCWAVMTEGAGYEDWHVHQNGWMSGVYYPEVPVGIAGGTDDAGCLAFGLQPAVIGEEAADRVGRHAIRPEAGRFLMFPSHVPHRTFPYGGKERRMCIAFDVVSQDRAAQSEGSNETFHDS